MSWLMAPLFISAAFAAVLPSEFLVKKIAQGRGEISAVRVHSRIYGFNETGEQKLLFSESTVVNRKTGKLSSDALDEAGKWLRHVQRNLNERELLLGDLLLFGANVGPLTRKLVDAQIPVKTSEELANLKDETERRTVELVSLRRWNGKVVWAIGPAATAGSQAQLWVDKEAFFPVRLLSQLNTINYELQFSQYKTVKGYSYPKDIVLLTNGTKTLRVELEEIDFSTDLQKQASTSPSEPSERPEVVKGLDHYYQLIR